jgi:ubiquinone/menaquinone biosynthesis C-methylase UbiE
MSTSAMLAHLLLERLSPRELARIPEPSLVMDDPSQVAAFSESGKGRGTLAAIHYFHALQASAVLRPGDQVLDLGCGPANQLLQMARLNPQVRFVGLDAAPTMLAIARQTVAEGRVDNVMLAPGNMTRLTAFADASMDGVLCTMSLHHLPDLPALHATLAEVRRVLKPGGGLYLADFGRLKRRATQHYFATERQEHQAAQFTQDFLHSLAAAFSLGELRQAAARLGQGVATHRTALAPFMVVIKSRNRRRPEPPLQSTAQAMFEALPDMQQRDFLAFARWFGASGLPLPCCPK